MASKRLMNVTTPPSALFLDNKMGVISTCPPLNSASAADIDTAVANARRAFNGEWGAFTGEQRGVVLNKLADLIEQHTQEIAYFESLCSGTPISFLKSTMPSVVSVFRYYADWTDKYKGDYFPPEDGFCKIVEHTSVGVCAGVTAWNGSLHFLAWKSAPALATGNTVILKPSEKSPLGTLSVANLISKAGFPPGAFQIVAVITRFIWAGDVGASLASHMDIDKISFTGSTGTVRKVQDAATKSNLKRVTYELGGKSPAVVFEDADIERNLFWCTFGITGNSGQVCTATSRLFVQESIAEKFIEATLGADPMSPETQYGPLVDKAQYERVRIYIDDAQKVLSPVVGGDTYSVDDYYVAPTIFLNPPSDAKIYREEIFGPVLCIKTFKTEEQAIALANDTNYGLAGSAYTQDIERALRVSRAIRGGTVGINCTSIASPQVPMGGFKLSGIGRGLGEYALRHYTEPKTIVIK
ncbi:aldehyde dehydrogenase [Penicillium chermesinum]|uniref:aldehyde dehydrogenase (NAD(+)) n=1 Tax=Penicillium chermesinum TaxID=63820 RepID=A0A9W9NL21_9EURO|nr:aldehyde dehydrogenase [Penicillium chermesinum]KAJ5220568.1 aldehyde dehydrogenase [Penicillium chermesinum]